MARAVPVGWPRSGGFFGAGVSLSIFELGSVRCLIVFLRYVIKLNMVGPPNRRPVIRLLDAVQYQQHQPAVSVADWVLASLAFFSTCRAQLC